MMRSTGTSYVTKAALIGGLCLGALSLGAGAPYAKSDGGTGANSALETLGKSPIAVPLRDGLRLEYEGYFGGFHIGSARAVMERDGEGYRVSAEARARGLLERLLRMDPRQRATANDALRHPYVAGLPAGREQEARRSLAALARRTAQAMRD